MPGKVLPASINLKHLNREDKREEWKVELKEKSWLPDESTFRESNELTPFPRI